jgi:hypothetical protein
LIVGGLQEQEERLVAISQHGRIIDLDQPVARYLVPADRGAWMALTETAIQRRGLTRRYEEIRGQMALW